MKKTPFPGVNCRKIDLHQSKLWKNRPFPGVCTKKMTPIQAQHPRIPSYRECPFPRAPAQRVMSCITIDSRLYGYASLHCYKLCQPYGNATDKRINSCVPFILTVLFVYITSLVCGNALRSVADLIRPWSYIIAP